MKEGTKVTVVSSVSGHKFDIGEVVVRKWGKYEDNVCMGFYSEKNGHWYLDPDEYKICDKGYAIELAVEAANLALEMGFSRAVWEQMFAAIDTAYEEMEEEQ
jgi:hypothetical protein